MIVLDSNLLIYAVDRRSVFHDRAKLWLERATEGQESVGLAWISLLAFLRVTTLASFPERLSGEEALGLVTFWLARPATRILHPGPRHFEILGRLLTQVGTAGNLTSDAHLAAIAIEHGAEVYTTDADFARFPGLAWRNPLVSGSH